MRRRFAALLCAVALMGALIGFPVRAHAAATAAAVGLTAVGFAVTVAAFLNLAGIYPFNDSSSSASITFGDWAQDNLAALVEQYNATNPDIPLTPQTIRAYALGATIAVTHNAWVALRAFVGWIKDTFTLADNQEGVEVGTFPGGFFDVPTVTSWPSVDYVRNNGFCVGVDSEGKGRYVMANSVFNNARGFIFDDSGDYKVRILYTGMASVYDYDNAYSYMAYYVPSPPGWYLETYRTSRDESGSVYTDTATGMTVYANVGPYASRFGVKVPADGLPIYTTMAAAVADYCATFGQINEFQGITIDTTVVSVPAALPEGAEFGGLQAAELGAGATVDALEGVIEDGVMGRQQPLVRPVEVEVQQGLEVDAETGAVTENPVVIRPTDIPLVASDFSIPSLSTVWPFSIPWDIARIYQAFDAEPVSPTEFHLSFDFPILSNEPVQVDIALPENAQAAFDRVAQVVRAFTLIIVCIAYTVWIGRFIRW